MVLMQHLKDSMLVGKAFRNQILWLSVEFNNFCSTAQSEQRESL